MTVQRRQKREAMGYCTFELVGCVVLYSTPSAYSQARDAHWSRSTGSILVRSGSLLESPVDFARMRRWHLPRYSRRRSPLPGRIDCHGSNPRRTTNVSIMHVRVSGRHYWTRQCDASSWPAGMQAYLCIQGGSFFRNATTNAGTKMDRGHIRRYIPMHRKLHRILRDRFLAAKGSRTRVPRAVHMAVPFCEG